MSEPLAIIHSDFGRVTLMQLDQSIAEHAHRECHIIYKVDGPDIVFNTGQIQHRLTNESLLLVNPWQPHSYQHEPDSAPVTLLMFYFRPEWLKSLDPRFALSAHPRFFPEQHVGVNTQAKWLIQEVIHLITGYNTPTKTTLLQLMADCFRGFMQGQQLPTELYPAGRVGELGYDVRIRKIVNHLIAHQGECEGFAPLANAFQLSKAQFYRLFQRSLGMTPSTFVNMLKMERCLPQVLQPEQPLQAIAEELGYFPQGNFTRFFLRYQGISPSHYRKLAQHL